MFIDMDYIFEWLLFNVNSTIFQLCHGKNKLISNEMIMGPLYTRPTRLFEFL